MAQCNAGNRVVQATVVQGNYHPGAPGNGGPGYGIQMGQPIGTTQVIGQPIYVNDGLGPGYGGYGGYGGAWDDRPPTVDERGAGTGWMLYAIGCFLCLCFGPVGPLFWFVVAGMHYCKPKSVRDSLPQEAQVARVSLMTAVGSTIGLGILIFLLVTVVAPNSSLYRGPFACQAPCSGWTSSSSPADVEVCQNIFSRRCARPDARGCLREESRCRQVATTESCPQSCDTFSGFASRMDEFVCFDNATRVCSESMQSSCQSNLERCRRCRPLS